MKKLQTSIMVAVLVFGFVGFASAGYFGPNPDFGSVTGLLSDSNYFNGYEVVSELDFMGEWDYTAIAFEAGDTNRVREVSGGSQTFVTTNTSNFGQWDRIDFSGDEPNNLQFKDKDTNFRKKLDVYDSNDTDYFNLYRLISESNALTWISDSFYLPEGTIIVGWNDNGSGDGDYDDIIVAMKPVPEPGTIILLGAGLLGLVGLRRKFKK